MACPWFLHMEYVGERHAAPGAMLPIQTGHRENGNGPRLVIARPQRGRGNLGEALVARTNRRQNGTHRLRL